MILLFIVIWWVFYVFQQKNVIPTDNEIVPNSQQQNNDESLSGTQWTWVMLSGSVISGAFDDTELPLDQQSAGVEELTNTWNQESDPEVDEIINILEELIAESETSN